MMRIEFAPVNVVHVAILSVAVLGILLLLGKGPYKALTLFLAVLATEQVFNLLEELTGLGDFYLVTPAIQLSYGPLYYLLTKNLVYGDIDLKSHWPHFIPFLLGLAFTAWWPMVLRAAFLVLITYFVISMRLLRRHHVALAEVTSDTDRHTLRWLSRTLIVIFCISCIDFVRLNLQPYLDYEILVNWYFVATTIGLGYTTYLLLKAVRQPSLYSGIVDRDQLREPADCSGTEQARALFETIDQHVRGSEAFRQPRYALKNLAEETGLSQSYVSWAINEGASQSFSDYINSLRVNELKQRLAVRPRRQNLLDIAFDVGFNSKSSFNAVFKRLAGLSPSEYVRTLRAHSPP